MPYEEKNPAWRNQPFHPGTYANPYSAKLPRRVFPSAAALCHTSLTIYLPAPAGHRLNNFPDEPQRNSEDGNIPDIPPEPLFPLQYDRSCGTPT